MKERKRTRVALVGTGMVGSSYAYAMMQSGTADEIVLIDVNKRKAEGEAMDLNHGMPFAAPVRIWAGTYEDCRDAEVVAITAGAAQKPGESRLALLEKNTKVFESVVQHVMHAGFNGVFVVATNPVDVLTYATWKFSGLPPAQVVGSGTMLDTARLRYLLGDHFHVDPRNVHAYIMGEHGETEFALWSHADIAGRPVAEMCAEKHECSMTDLDAIFHDVRDAAAQIIERKGATYYAVGLALQRLTEAILRDENAILTVSTYLNGQYGLNDIFIGVPAVVNAGGVREVIELSLSDEEQRALRESARVLKEAATPVLV